MLCSRNSHFVDCMLWSIYWATIVPCLVQYIVIVHFCFWKFNVLTGLKCGNSLPVIAIDHLMTTVLSLIRVDTEPAHQDLPIWHAVGQDAVPAVEVRTHTTRERLVLRIFAAFELHTSVLCGVAMVTFNSCQHVIRWTHEADWFVPGINIVVGPAACRRGCSRWGIPTSEHPSSVLGAVAMDAEHTPEYLSLWTLVLEWLIPVVHVSSASP